MRRPEPAGAVDHPIPAIRRLTHRAASRTMVRMDPSSQRPLPSPAFTGTLPQRLSPMLAVSRAEPFDSGEHIFEVLWQGIRVLASLEEGRVRLRSRTDQDLTPFFPEIAALLHKRVHGDGVLLDGMLTTPDAKGVPRLGGLLRRLHGRDEESRGIAVTFQVFDLLYRDMRPLLRFPLLRRKQALRETIEPDESVQLGHYEEGAGTAFFEAATRLGLPGIVAKERASPYLPGRRPAWASVLAAREADVVIGGYTMADGRKGRFGSLLLGVYDDTPGARLRHVATVAGGFAAEEAHIIAGLLGGLHTADCPFFDPPRMGRLLYWCRPELVARVSYGELAPGGQMQFAIFKGLRPDLDPRWCVAPA